MSGPVSDTLLARHEAEAQREADILAAALELLLETGFEAMTFDALARRAHVGKATLYARWGSKPKLVMAAMEHEAQRRRDGGLRGAPDRGSLRADLIAVAEELQDDQQRSGKLLLALAHAVQEDADIAAAVDRLAAGSRQQSRALLERAVARGEIDSAALDLPFVLELLPALLVSNLLLRPSEVVDASAVVDRILLPLLTSDPRSPR